MRKALVALLLLICGVARADPPGMVTGGYYHSILHIYAEGQQTSQPTDINGIPYVNCFVGCSASGGTLTVQGVGGGFPLPISAASLPLPTGAATAANQTSVQGTAGAPAATVESVQGVVGGTPVPVSGTFSIGGTAANNADGVAAVGTGLGQQQEYPFLWNGATFDRWYGDKTNGAFVNIKTSVALPVTGTFFQATQPVSAASLPLPSGASTSANQATEITSLGTINTTLGSPFQAGGAISNTSFGATQSGSWTVQPGNTANTVPWMVQEAALAPGAATAALQSSVQGPVGQPAMKALSIQGAPLMTPLLVQPAGPFPVTAQPATASRVSGTASQTSGTTSTLLIPGTGQRIYVTSFSCANTGASASLISFQDGSGGSTLWTTIVPAGGGSNLGGSTPLFWTSNGNPLYWVPATSSSTVYCSAAGFSGP